MKLGAIVCVCEKEREMMKNLVTAPLEGETLAAMKAVI